MATEFSMPTVYVGQVVLWRFTPNGPPSPALVTTVGPRTINVAVHVDGVMNHILKSGVRHVSDPDLKRISGHESGVWDFTEFDKKVMGLIEELGSMPAPAPKASAPSSNPAGRPSSGK